ncbi:MAG: hypothetical protein FD126_3023, partial [Elusimicrobia bacterium]
RGGGFRFFALVVFLGVPAAAGVTADGSLKTLYSYTRSPISKRLHWGDMTRARLSLKAETPEPDRGWALRAEADYDHEIRVGTRLNSPEHRQFGAGEPERYFTMDQHVSSGTDGEWRHLLYRGWVEAEAAGWKARFGRQRVAWGTGKIWNPVDVLNPYQPTTLEREERLGLEALSLRRGIGEVGQAEAVWAFEESWAKSDLLGRVRGNPGGADLALLGGKLAGSTGSWLAGGELAWDLRGGTLHSEVSYTDLELRTPFWRGLVGYEYGFTADPPLSVLEDFWFNVEWFHNGRGRDNPARYDVGLLRGGREVALGRDYGGVAMKKELHPLLYIELSWLRNLRDASHFLSPSVNWNAVGDLHVFAGWQRFGGRPVTEFGRQPDAFYSGAQLFF